MTKETDVAQMTALSEAGIPETISSELLKSVQGVDETSRADLESLHITQPLGNKRQVEVRSFRNLWLNLRQMWQKSLADAPLAAASAYLKPELAVFYVLKLAAVVCEVATIKLSEEHADVVIAIWHSKPPAKLTEVASRLEGKKALASLRPILDDLERMWVLEFLDQNHVGLIQDVITHY